MVENVTELKKKNYIVPMLLIIILFLVGICMYLYLTKENKAKENNKECDKCIKEVTFDPTILDEIGDAYYWIEQKNIDNMNNLNNNIKFCIAANNVEKDVQDDNNKYIGYRKDTLDKALKNVFGADVTIEQKNINEEGKTDVVFTLDCPYGYDYNATKKEYVEGERRFGFEASSPVVRSKLVKIEEYNSYYVIYIKANALSDYDITEGNMTDVEISEYIEKGNTYKLTFEKADLSPIWTKFEVIK